jgi:hypothetical protein
MTIALTYVLPIKWSEELDRDELTRYLKRLAGYVDEVLVVDGSEEKAFSDNAEAWTPYVKHLAPDSDLSFANGKVDGVITGVRAAGHEKVVIADDDVRYARQELKRIADLLDDFDLVRPQNYFAEPMPWHAYLDTARSLINRSLGRDFPGTLGFRRSALVRLGGYDGDTMFENLELIRTIKASGGTETAPLDLFVLRLPPSSDRFVAQRIRQAYDEFVLPERMAVWLAVVPFLAWAIGTRKKGAVAAYLGATIGLAELGRRRGHGARAFPPRASLYAPAWVLERGISMWLALEAKLTGGVRYGGGRIQKAANSRRWHKKGGAREKVL